MDKLTAIILLQVLAIVTTDVTYYRKNGYNYARIENNRPIVISNDFYVGCNHTPQIRQSRFSLINAVKTLSTETSGKWTKLITDIPIVLHDKIPILEYKGKKYCVWDTYNINCPFDQIIVSKTPHTYEKYNYITFECLYTTDKELTMITHHDYK